MSEPVETADNKVFYSDETRGGIAPADWRVRQPPPNPTQTAFDGGFVMAQPGDANTPDDFVMADGQ